MTNPAQDKDIKYWFIETKLSPAIPASTLIQRPNATGILDYIHSHPAGFVLAPAGYGKSSLLSQWRHIALQKGHKIAWVSLDYSESDARQFASYIISALARAGLGLDSLELAAGQWLNEIPVNAIIPQLLEAFAGTKETFFLILDDYYRAESDEVNAMLLSLLDYAPKNLKIIISSRNQPKLNVAGRIAAGKAFELGTSILKFSLPEVETFTGKEFDNSMIETLMEETDGWPVALQLAKIAKLDNPKRKKTFAGNQQYIINYFTEQILDKCNDNERLFLLKTSILEQFNTSLAQSVTNISNVGNLIDNSPHLRSLLITLESTEIWFRYHHLFGELLRAQLKYHLPEHVPSLHIKASEWYHDHGMVSEAVRHAKLADDTERAASLFLEAGGWELVLYGGVGLMRSLLTNFSNEDFDVFPRLRLAYIYSLAKDGRVQEASNQCALIQESQIADPVTTRDYHVISTLLNVYMDDYSKMNSVNNLSQLLVGWPHQDAIGRSILESGLVLGAMAEGKFDIAERTAADCVSSMRRAETILGINYLYIHLGQIAMHRGQFALAEAHFLEASKLAQDNFGADSGLKTNSEVDINALKYWRDLDTLDPEHMKKQIRKACETDGWFEIYATGFSCLFYYCWHNKNADIAAHLLEIFIENAKHRQIKRLEMLLLAYKFMAVLADTDNKDATKSAFEALQASLKTTQFYRHAIDWAPHNEIIYILGIAHVFGYRVCNIDNLLCRAIEVSRNNDAQLYLIRLLVIRGTIRAQMEKQDDGIKDIYEAAQYAVGATIKTPFIIAPQITNLISAAIRQAREDPGKRLLINFLSTCRAMGKRQGTSIKPDDDTVLSARESDVLAELALGQSNKQIARALDMTDHTVKFHLRNIFIKLNVDNRIAALNAARDMYLI